VEQITAFLFDQGGHEDPKPLKANAGKSFQGSIVLGMGFTFDDSGEADDDTPGIPSPIATMERLIAENPRNAEVIFPYIGGKEMNDSPTHAHYRYVIDFRDRSEEECRREWPDLMRLLDKKVKPERTRTKTDGDFVLRDPLPQRWWHHADKRPALYSCARSLERVLAVARVANALAFTYLSSKIVYNEKTILFTNEAAALMSLLQSRLHEQFARFLSSSLKDDLQYTPSVCFETFPFPAVFLGSADSEPAQTTHRHALDNIGKRYHQFRAELMVTNNEGLTSTYNRFHDPSETSEGILELRSLHQQMDQAVLQAYGWDDIPTRCGFGLDYLDSDDDTTLPADLQERIASGDLFFATASEACAFQAQLRQVGAVKASRRLAWRHRWPDAVRDEVLARLLALNAERYAEEQAMGLQGKREKAGAGGGGKRRGRPPRSTPSSEPETQQMEQMGLGL
jgi:hypothetical protein